MEILGIIAGYFLICGLMLFIMNYPMAALIIFVVLAGLSQTPWGHAVKRWVEE